MLSSLTYFWTLLLTQLFSIAPRVNVNFINRGWIVEIFSVHFPGLLYGIQKSKCVFFSALRVLWCVPFVFLPITSAQFQLPPQSFFHSFKACMLSGKYVFATTSPTGLILSYPSLPSISFSDFSWNILLWGLRRKWQCSEALEKNYKIESEKRD